MGLTNLPVYNSQNSTVKSFDNFYSSPVEIDPTVLAAMQGYFTNKGFDEVASEQISVTIITQSKQDGYNPMQILDTLRGLSTVELSGLIAEILNYNRLKTSSLGYAPTISPNPEVARNIIA